MWGSIIPLIKEDTRSLDYSSYVSESSSCSVWCLLRSEQESRLK